MVESFCKIVAQSLQELLEVTVDPCQHFLILDSSSATKFSAHVIVHIPKNTTEDSASEEPGPSEWIFPDNISLKRIVMNICSKLLKENACLVKTGDEKRITFFCDLSVYSRNRNFRLYQSSKCGKEETLKLANYCNFYKFRSILPKHAQIFLDSLVIPFNCQKLSIFDLKNLPNIRTLNSTLDSYRRHLDGLQNGNILPELMQSAPFQERQNIVENPLEKDEQRRDFPSSEHPVGVKELSGGPPPSPFPRLDSFVLQNVFEKFNPTAGIRVWRLICSERSNQLVEKSENTNGRTKGKIYQLQYQLTNSRFCLNRGREHRSQNVYWVVDLSAFYYVQRCFDKVDCPNYISPAFAFPKEICAYLHREIGSVFNRFGIAPAEYVLPNLNDLNSRRYQAESDSFNKSMEWRKKYQNIDFLELITPCEEQLDNVGDESSENVSPSNGKENVDFLLRQHEQMVIEASRPDATIKDFKTLLQFRTRLIAAQLLPLEAFFDGVPKKVSEKAQQFYNGLKWAIT